MGRVPGRLPAGVPARAGLRARARGHDGGAARATFPVVVRLVHGDIVDARASVIVVNHFNGLPPSGAEAAMDAALGGAISRRAANGSIDGRFGSTHFLPTGTSPVAASAVLVVGLGDPETFEVSHLRQVGAAIAEVCATLRLRDAATILHGAGALNLAPERAACAIVEGLLDAVAAVENGTLLRELSIVERDAEVLAAAGRGVRAAVVPKGLRRYVVEDEAVALRPPPVPQPLRTPEHLRIGITRRGSRVKLTVIDAGGIRTSATTPYPVNVVREIHARLEAALTDRDGGRTSEQLAGIGHALFDAFLGETRIDVVARLRAARGGFVILRLDPSTVDLPWELLHADGGFVCRRCLLARHVELTSPGRQNAFPRPRERIRALVIGDPDGDLPGARGEAEEVATALEGHGGEVTALIGGATYAKVSALLDREDFDLLHYAGHARYESLDEGSSGLMLRGKVLTADDMRTRRYLPRVVVANACNAAQTGAPFGGAARTRDMVAALLRNGARAVVGSMWKVDDDAARTFARHVYATLLTPQDDGTAVPIGAAVHAGREAVIAEHGGDEPAWAGYALFGAPFKPVL